MDSPSIYKNETFTLDGERVTLKPYRTDYEVENAEVLATFDDKTIFTKSESKEENLEVSALEELSAELEEKSLEDEDLVLEDGVITFLKE